MDAMRIAITREQTNAVSSFAPTYEYSMAFRAFEEREYLPAHIRFTFSTDRPGISKISLFTGYIMGDKFAELARLMFEADPQAAIRAFGSVMRDADIQKCPEQTASDAA